MPSLSFVPPRSSDSTPPAVVRRPPAVSIDLAHRPREDRARARKGVTGRWRHHIVPSKTVRARPALSTPIDSGRTPPDQRRRSGYATYRATRRDLGRKETKPAATGERCPTRSVARVRRPMSPRHATEPESPAGDEVEPSIPETATVHNRRDNATRGVSPPSPLRSNYERFKRSNYNIRHRSWNYRGCWHQACPPIGHQRHVFGLRSIRPLGSHASPAPTFIFTTSPCWEWVSCAPAATLKRGSRLAGSLSGIEP